MPAGTVDNRVILRVGCGLAPHGHQRDPLRGARLAHGVERPLPRAPPAQQPDHHGGHAVQRRLGLEPPHPGQPAPHPWERRRQPVHDRPERQQLGLGIAKKQDHRSSGVGRWRRGAASCGRTARRRMWSSSTTGSRSAGGCPSRGWVPTCPGRRGRGGPRPGRRPPRRASRARPPPAPPPPPWAQAAATFPHTSPDPSRGPAPSAEATGSRCPANNQSLSRPTSPVASIEPYTTHDGRPRPMPTAIRSARTSGATPVSSQHASAVPATR